MAVVADSGITTRSRILAGMTHIDSTHFIHGRSLDWTICSYDDGADAWHETVQTAKTTLRHVSFAAVVNATPPGEVADDALRRARGLHRKRAVDEAWRLRGLDAWDAVWLADSDISFEKFDLARFLLRRACSLAGGAPLIVQPVIRQNTQCWPYNYQTYGRSSETLPWERILMLRTAWVESQVVLIDAPFLQWFYETKIVQKVLSLQNHSYRVSWGTDAIWCGAAKEYASERNLTRDACAVVVVPIDHADTKSISSKGGSYIMHGFKLLEAAGIARFRKHACAEGTAPTSGPGCLDISHRWLSTFAYRACDAKTRPTSPSDLVHVQRCAALSLEGCSAGGGDSSVATIGDACNELVPLYTPPPSPPPPPPKPPSPPPRYYPYVPPICRVHTSEHCMRGTAAIRCPINIKGQRRTNRSSISQPTVTETGFWDLPSDYVYYLDRSLAAALARFFHEEEADVVEFGAGLGCYTHALADAGITVRGFDGLAAIAKRTGGLVRSADLATDVSQTVGNSSWVLCLEVAEHIPKQFEGQFLRNLGATARDGLVLSWSASSVGQGHVNARDARWVALRMRGLGWVLDKGATMTLRASVRNIFSLRDTLIVFRRSRGGDPP